MEFILNVQRSVREIAGKIGYVIDSHHENNFSMVRKLNGGDYPCFHLHVTMINGGEIGYRLILHIDGRKMADERDCEHHGEYRGEAVEEEVERIKGTIDAVESE